MKKEKSFTQKLIPWIVLAVILYTVADIVLQSVYGVEISPTLTTAFFSFFGVELIGMTTIKNTKTRHQGDVPDISIINPEESEDI